MTVHVIWAPLGLLPPRGGGDGGGLADGVGAGLGDTDGDGDGLGEVGIVQVKVVVLSSWLHPPPVDFTVTVKMYVPGVKFWVTLKSTLSLLVPPWGLIRPVLALDGVCQLCARATPAGAVTVTFAVLPALPLPETPIRSTVRPVCVYGGVPDGMVNDEGVALTPVHE
jgi:hypothetical protein